MPRTVLVTGASGFVGAHLLRLLAQEPGLDLVGWTRDVIPPGDGVRWTVIEMADAHAVTREIARVRPDVVFHLAGAAHVGQSFATVADTLATNVIGTARLFDALRAADLRPRVLVTGSSTVYRTADTPLDEGASPIGPSSPYGFSKLAQERLSVRAWREDGLPVVVTRSFNHVGPGQAPGYFAPSFAKQIAEIEAGLRPPVMMVGNLGVRRDLTDVRDTVRAYRLLADHGTPGEVYNVCTGRAHGIGEILHALLSATSTPIDVQVDPALLRPSDTPVVVGAYAKLHAATGWTPQFDMPATLADVLDDWRARVRAGGA